MKTSAIAKVLFFAMLCCAVQPAASQEIRLGMTGGNKYIGEEFNVQIQVTDLKRSQTVNVRYTGEASGFVVKTPPARSDRSQNFFGNFSRTVSFTYTVAVLRDGEAKIGPFVVEIDGKELETEPIIFTAEIQAIPVDPNMQLELKLPERNVYVGEHVPIEIEWSYSGTQEVRDYAHAKSKITSVLFDQFRFEDFSVQRDDNYLVLETAAGKLPLLTRVSLERKRDEELLVHRGTRYLIAESPGEYTDLQLQCSTRKAIRFENLGFGRRAVSEWELSSAVSSPQTLAILPIPTAGRPKSFSGAVGERFVIDAVANRSVVRVGDPISLTITVSGGDNLTDISLPFVQGNDLLDSEKFTLPTESPSGRVDSGEKQFSVALRVNSVDISEIPALPFSWFNPISEKFETGYSDPIALQVREAQIVSSSDVVSSAEAKQTEFSEPKTAGSLPASVDLLGANLAIENNATKLLGGSLILARPWTAWLLYISGAAVLILCFLVQARGKIDHSALAKKQQRRTTQTKIESAGRMPPREAAREIAAALRDLLAQHPEAERAAAERVIESCDNMVYSPEAPSSSTISEMVEQARTVASRLENHS